jgi:hypothetical protein
MWTTTMRALAVLLSSAAAVRFALASRGGQYFDWDEHRYGFSTLMLERLRPGDVGGALDIFFRYPDHPGFKILGLGPAALHQAINPGRAISDMRLPSGDTALALGLLAAWAALSPADRAVASAGAGFLAGAAFATYLGYWLLAVTVLALHVFRPASSPGRWLRRIVRYGAGFVIVPGLIIIASDLRNRPLLQMTRRFAGDGRVIATWRHPRQLPLLQYHGYTPGQRRFMRSTDASIRLIDRGSDPAVTIEQR